MYDVIFEWPLNRFGQLQNGLEGEWHEHVAFALVELGLKLHPMQPQGVEEGRQTLHQAQDTHCQESPKGKNGPQYDAAIPKGRNINFISLLENQE